MKNFLYFVAVLVFAFAIVSAIPILSAGFNMDVLPFMASTGLGIGLGAALMGIGYLCGKSDQNRIQEKSVSGEKKDSEFGMMEIFLISISVLLVIVIGFVYRH